MNILMLTNTFHPHVSGVARSVEAFTEEYRRRGHQVLVVAPEFPNLPRTEIDVVRIPALQNFNGSDFSVALPVSGLLMEALDSFQPDVVHTHAPYLLGMTAIRVARYRQLPLVFTHHTLYEQYTHYVPGDSPTFKRFVIELATCYANLCDQVFAPSGSIARLLRKRGVKTPIAVVPTGVDVARFAQGDGSGFRAAMSIPEDAFVIGHLGRLAPEKNLGFLAEAVARFIKIDSRAHFLVGGAGPSQADIGTLFTRAGLSSRLHFAGVLRQPQLSDAYHAMDVFAFASKSETQGMVLTEAMAAGLPVVALDATGVREVVDDEINGRLLHEETLMAFVSALRWVANLPQVQMQNLQERARHTADAFSMPRTASKSLAHYEALRERAFVERSAQYSQWERLFQLVSAEWDVITGMAEAATAALSGKGGNEDAGA